MPPTRTGKPGAIRVFAAEAESAKRRLLTEGVFDKYVKPHSERDGVVFGVTDVARALALVPGAVVVDLSDAAPHEPLEAREPRVRMLRDLAARGWPEDALRLVPRKWEKLGDVVVLRVPPPLMGREDELAEAVAAALKARTVLADEGGVAGEFREMLRTRFLLGDDAETVHTENGVRYKLDASKLMFSSGNVEERRRAATLPAAGETVVDMFSGVGYFTLPLAVHARPARIVACEKNPLAFRYLVENVALNGVTDVVEPWRGDNRDLPMRGEADRVLMGYVGGVHAFLPKALDLVRSGGGVIHYHDTAHERTWGSEMEAHVARAAAAAGRAVAVEDARVVKSYSPGVVHAVLDVRVR